jgi:hypothetical protein
VIAALSLVILKRKLVILNSFQDLPRQSAKPGGILKQVQNDDALSHHCAARNGI